MSEVKYMRIYSDAYGESRLETHTTVTFPNVYAPPAPALNISEPSDAKRYVMAHFPAGWTSDLHPSPRRQLYIQLTGNMMGELSDGTEFELSPGDMLLMEDTTGKGHKAQPLNGQAASAIMVHLE